MSTQQRPERVININIGPRLQPIEPPPEKRKVRVINLTRWFGQFIVLTTGSRWKEQIKVELYPSFHGWGLDAEVIVKANFLGFSLAWIGQKEFTYAVRIVVSGPIYEGPYKTAEDGWHQITEWEGRNHSSRKPK